MAKASSKKSTKKVQRHYPAQRNIRLADDAATTAGGRVVFADQVASAANRRLYRQSRMYSLKVDIDLGSAEALNGCDVYVLRDTWDLHGAYKFAMKNYYNAHKEELMQANGAKARWHDFRVVSDFQADKMVPSVARPATSGAAISNTRLTTGSFPFSRVVDAAGGEFEFTLGVATVGTPSQFSIIEEWADRDQVDDDPANTATDLPYSGLTEDLDEANYDILRVSGNEPPYNNVSDGESTLWTKVATLQDAGTGATKLTTGYFDAPLGIVLLVSAGFPGSGSPRTATGVTLCFQKGDYKGVKAPAYATPVLTAEMEYEVV